MLRAMDTPEDLRLDIISGSNKLRGEEILK